MATTDLEKLVVQMSLDMRQFERELAKANGTTRTQLTKVERQFQTSQKKIQGIVAQFGRGLAGGLAIGGAAAAGAIISRFVTDTVKQVADLGDAADKIGITAEQFQVLGFAAKQSGADVGDMETALLRFNKSVADASRGQGELLKVFQANGIALRDQQGNIRPLFELFLEFTNLLQRAGSETDQFAIGSAAMGRSFAQVRVAIAGGTEGINQFEKSLRDLGIVSNENVATAQKLDDRLKAIAEGGLNQLRSGLLTVIDLADDLTGWLRSIFDWMSKISGLGGPAAQSILQALRNNPITAMSIRALELISGTIGQQQEALSRPAQPFRGGALAGRAATVVPTTADTAAQREAERLRKQRIADLAREAEAFDKSLQSQSERNQALALEIAIMGQSLEQQETARTRMELINEALQNNIALTPEVIAQIDALATEYGQLASAAESAQASQEAVVELNSALRDSTKDFFSEIANGVSASDALQNSLAKLNQRLLDLLLNKAFDILFQTQPGAPAGGILANLFHTGGVVGRAGPARRVNPLAFVGAPHMQRGGEVPAILHTGETVLPRGVKAGGNVKVIINNHTGEPVSQRESSSGINGERQIEIIIGRMISDGRVDGPMRRRFGAGALTSQR